MKENETTDTKDTKYKSENPIIQRCLDILDNPDIEIGKPTNGVYSIYDNDTGERIFSTTNGYSLSVGKVLDGVISFYIDRKENGLDFSGITLIWDKVTQILQSRGQNKVQSALEYLSSKTAETKTQENSNSELEESKENKPTKTRKVLTGIIGTVVILFLIQSVIYTIEEIDKKQRIDKQTEAYEKTLPGYLEQKQKVADYRDSLKKNYNR